MEWHCVAISQQDWENLIQQLSTSNDEQEQELYSYLKDQLYPPIERMLIQVLFLSSFTFTLMDTR